ncbi:Mitogen-activated protein kinase kinase kinase ANP1 [Platanthera zijinensis]|uniref:Mitogen-activated protein kinase kinase kinase ANP1 n=1 Tax=Platanthera zijinensis TaxID=2320716 RepID=A0AAP0BYB7_9ASPA
MERRKFPIRPEDYVLFETIGQGASAVVQRALCVPHNEIIAVKIIDFERTGSDLDSISREAQTMILIDHHNVLKSHCSFVKDHNLWVVMPYMAGGSCLHIMKSAFPNGFEELIIATVLKEVLKGLEYLHHHGHIHRDVKAGNILVDSKGGIKLGDFGVSACLFVSGDRQRSRNTFVGTPCWMAPEVMEMKGYDFKADIWSFGITALELAHGHAPFSKYPPMKVLLMTLQNAPPGLDYESDKKFSRSFKHMIASCLVKDPSKRPTAQKLLKHTFFKQARSQDYIARKLLEGLAALGDRYQALKEKEENLLAEKKMPDGKKEEISQNEYKRGISGWNFDIEDLKAQASLIPCNEDVGKDQGASNSFFDYDGAQEKMFDRSYSKISSFKDYDDIAESDLLQNKLSIFPPSDETTYSLRDQADGSDNEKKGITEQQEVMHLQRTEMDNLHQNCDAEFNGQCALSVSEKKVSTTSELDENSAIGSPTHSFQEQLISTTCSTDVPKLSKVGSLKQQNLQQSIINSNGEASQNGSPAEIASKMFKPAGSSGDEFDDKSKLPIVQQKGRFKVTSESIEFDKASCLSLQKSQSMQVIWQNQPQSISPTAEFPPTSNGGNSLFQQLHLILQSNIAQRDHILSMMKQMSTCDSSAIKLVDGTSLPSPTAASEKSLLEAAHEREKELVQEVSELHWRLVCSQEEVQRLKAKHTQVQ